MAVRSNVIPMPSLAGASDLRSAAGGTRVPSSFGPDDTTTPENYGIGDEFYGAGYNANHYFAGPRAQELEFRGRFYHGTQHDWRPYDQDGRMLGPKEQGGFAGQMQFLNSAENPSYVPLSVRRPNAPYRLGRIMVKQFTGLLFGQGRWPTLTSDDPESQAFAEAISKAANFWNRFNRARDLGGSRGTSMLSWSFANGKPRVRVHNGRFCTVLKWWDVDEHIPEHVTELYQSEATRQTPDGAETYFVWVRRDWTMEADVAFLPVEVTGDNPVQWTVDEERTIVHGDGEAHVVWLTNFADDEDPASTDGVPDYDTLYEALTTIDELNSLIVRGVGKNIDPTLLLKVEQAMLRKGVVLKGSDNALNVGVDGGDASYLTIPADVVTTGKALIEMLRQQTLEAGQCVIPDPDKVAAAGSSSVALKMIYYIAITAADLLRDPYGKGIVRLAEQIQNSAARRMGAAGEAPELQEEVEVVVDEPVAEDELADEQGVTLPHESLPSDIQEPARAPVEYYFDLPDRVVAEPELDDTGNPTGKTLQRLVPIRPGRGSFELRWPDYFPPTATDKQAQAGALSTAAGGKPVMSQRTATEEAANLYGYDPIRETERMAAERKIAHDEEQGLFPTFGDDAAGPAPAAAGGGGGEGLITPSAMEVVSTVNEARARAPVEPGQPPLGPLLLPDGVTPDPDGFLTVSAFRAKMEAKLSKEGAFQADVPPEPEEPAPPAGQPVVDEEVPEAPAFPVE